MLIKNSLPDIIEQIGREVSYQISRGLKPVKLTISPEVHEILRQQARVSRGRTLLTHDPEVRGCPPLPVTIEKKFIGPSSYAIGYEEAAPTTEKMFDKHRQVG